MSCPSSATAIRVVGSGHSFTPIAQTDDCLLSLDRLTGLYAVDPAERTVEVSLLRYRPGQIHG
ncbi:FAD-binding protein [Brevibacillus centrosporus]|nr:FAD-binding protein [Brevibacillus centrosporus]